MVILEQTDDCVKIEELFSQNFSGHYTSYLENMEIIRPAVRLSGNKLGFSINLLTVKQHIFVIFLNIDTLSVVGKGENERFEA